MSKWKIFKRRAAAFLIACLVAGNVMELTAAASSSPLYGVSFAAGGNGEIIPDADVSGYMENTLVDFQVKPDYGYVLDSLHNPVSISIHMPVDIMIAIASANEKVKKLWAVLM